VKGLTKYLALAVFAGAVALPGCGKKEGTLEKLGKKAEQTAEDADKKAAEAADQAAKKTTK